MSDLMKKLQTLAMPARLRVAAELLGAEALGPARELIEGVLDEIREISEGVPPGHYEAHPPMGGGDQTLQWKISLEGDRVFVTFGGTNAPRMYHVASRLVSQLQTSAIFCDFGEINDDRVVVSIVGGAISIATLSRLVQECMSLSRWVR